MGPQLMPHHCRLSGSSACLQLAGVASFVVVGLTRPQDLAAGTVFSSLVLFQIMRFPLLTLSTGLVEVRRARRCAVCGKGEERGKGESENGTSAMPMPISCPERHHAGASRS